jgi:hypothetical protein
LEEIESTDEVDAQDPVEIGGRDVEERLGLHDASRGDGTVDAPIELTATVRHSGTHLQLGNVELHGRSCDTTRHEYPSELNDLRILTIGKKEPRSGIRRALCNRPAHPLSSTSDDDRLSIEAVDLLVACPT